MEKYYVYIYLNPLKPGKFKYGKIKFDFEPFYVGKGIKKRSVIHLKEAKFVKENNIEKSTPKLNWHKLNTINQITELNLEPIIIKIYENITNDSAKRAEICLINLIGRADLQTGPLSNLTIGGENIGFYWKGKKREPFSEEHRKKLSLAKKGKPLSESHKINIGKNHRQTDKPVSPEARERNRITHLGKKYSDETNAKKGRSGKLHVSTNIYKITTPNNEILYTIGQPYDYFNSIGLQYYNIFAQKKLNKINYQIECLGNYLKNKEEFDKLTFYKNN